jgi:tRNA G18 (ribose-2'-O)-methylase SpoU
MRGYFGIGAEGISKSMNVGSLFRTAHAFDASFVFTVAAVYSRTEGAKADTSDATAHLPFYDFPDIKLMALPQGCSLVGIEITDDAIDLPSFHHPKNAAYILGPERGALSPAMTERCDYVIKIPTKFSINVGLAGALVMYDRLVSLGRFAPRSVATGGPTEALPEPVFGQPKSRAAMETYRAEPPAQDTFNKNK